jgi:hypothetical protein
MVLIPAAIAVVNIVAISGVSAFIIDRWYGMQKNHTYHHIVDPKNLTGYSRHRMKVTSLGFSAT